LAIGWLGVPEQYLIHCIKRSDLMNHDRRISRIGGVNPDGARWTMTVDEAIVAIEAGRWSFHIERNGRAVPIIIAISKYGSKYIKTADDRLHPESLLALPECG
jgi:uncharacterized protein DUF3892